MNIESLAQLLRISPNEVIQLGTSSAMLIAAILIGLLSAWIMTSIIHRLDLHYEPEKTNILLDRHNWRGPLNAIVPALCVAILFPLLRFPASMSAIVRHLLSLWTIGAFAYSAMRAVSVGRQLALCQFDLSRKDNLKARAATTQLRVIEQILGFAIIVIAAASMLMTFDKVRQVGVSLLASAGIIGIVLGFAAQRSIATVIAGIQIALTQPIRLDDVVIVEGEWGRIEEITLTYVIVRIWDKRRLVLPITYFIEKPFQNWTRTSAEILGTVYIYADYTIPFDPIRDELKRLLESNANWDKQVCSIQVTGATENTVEIRALMSSEDASKNWDLRCFAREKLIEYIQKNFPQHLPRTRVQMEKKGQRDEG